MKFARNPRPARRRGAEAFTLAEVLAALMFMAIVIPVALQGLRIAGRAGEYAERKREAVRVAERILNESIVMTNWNSSATSGVIPEDGREYRWSLRSQTWSEATTTTALRLLSVEVTFPVQGEEYSVELNTLALPQ